MAALFLSNAAVLRRFGWRSGWLHVLRHNHGIDLQARLVENRFATG
jgi:hypothetical protein